MSEHALLCTLSMWTDNWDVNAACVRWQVVQVPLPRTPVPVNVSPPRRLGSAFQPLQPLSRCASMACRWHAALHVKS